MKVLVIAPHADDEILGVGGTMARRIAEGHEVYVCVVTRGVEPLFSKSLVHTIREETKNCHSFLGIKKTFFFEHPAVMLENVSRHILNDCFFKIISEICPDEVFIPHWGDIQKDHQIATEAAMVVLRPKEKHAVKRIYAYETLSETLWNVPNTHNLFIPNIYIDISQHLENKIKAMDLYQSQIEAFPAARSIEAIKALARFRGATVGIEAAEAFELVRQLI